MEQLCSVCGMAIPADAPSGHCPRCLLDAARAAPQPSAASRPDIPTPSDLVRIFPEYSQFSLVREGGMGVVFSAIHDKLHRKVALKILPRSADPGEDMVAAEARFEREARALAALSHPNILTLFDYGSVDGWRYFITEFVEGQNLRNHWRAARLAPRFEVHQMIAPIRQVAEALAYAHERGVIHRDIKPENVLLGFDGRVRVADFGLAKRMGESASAPRLTETGDRLGTPHYMAPEQIEGRTDIDARCDLFSLGVLLYEALTGELPIGSFEPPSKKSRCDARLDLVVSRALARDVEKRFGSASEFAARLLEVESDRVPSVARNPLFVTTKEEERLRGGLALVGTGLAVAAILPWVTWNVDVWGRLSMNSTSLSLPEFIPIPCVLPGVFGALIVAVTILEAAGWIRPRWMWFQFGTLVNVVVVIAAWWRIESSPVQGPTEPRPGFGLFATLILLVATYLFLPRLRR